MPTKTKRRPAVRRAKGVSYYTVTPPTKDPKHPEIILAVFKCPWCSIVAGVQHELTGAAPPITCPRCNNVLRVPVDKALYLAFDLVVTK